MKPIDKIVFGDNQFFGINHMSEEKALQQSERFRDLSSVIEVIDMAYGAGIHGFMFNTHERVKLICEHFRSHPQKYSDLGLYVSMPYAHKYANAVAEKGIFGAIKDTILAENTTGEVLSLFAKGGSSLFERDLVQVMKILVDMEMKMFRGLNVKVVFIQNIVTDLLLGFGVKEPFIAFAEYVREKYGAEPGFVTLNLPKAVDFLAECGVDSPVICTTFNKEGFNMNPSRASYEEALAHDSYQAMAMSVLASGAISPAEAIEYVAANPQMKSIVFGASSQRNILETKRLIDKSGLGGAAA